MNKFSLAAAVLAACPVFAQSSYWIGNRNSNEIMRVSEWGSVLERVATTTNLRGCVRAPDGKVWIVRFIQTSFDIYDPATQTLTPVPVPSGSVTNIAFDAAGTAWITCNTTVVHQFDANGAFLQTITLPVNNAQGITVDALGNKWIAHRIAPASITRVDAAGVATNFPIVGATMLPIGPVADYRGLLQPSHIWVTGDSAQQIAEIDGATGATLNVYPVPMASVAYPPTFDINGRIWVSSFGNGTVVQLDQTNGSVLQTLTFGPNNIGITTDNLGRIRTTARTVAPAPCETRRLDPVTGALEMPTLLQFGAFISNGTQTAMSTQFQYSLVVAPVGDMDGDGDANFSEILAGTSPIDPDSNAGFTIESFGVTQNGSTPSFEIKSSGLWVVGFSLALFPATPIPGFGGTVKIDLSTLLSTSAGVGNTSIPIAIPSNPALVGFELFAQGLLFNGTTFDFKNVTGMKVW